MHHLVYLLDNIPSKNFINRSKTFDFDQRSDSVSINSPIEPNIITESLESKCSEYH